MHYLQEAGQQTLPVSWRFFSLWNVIFFISDRDGQMDIHIISRDGKAIFRLTNTPAVESQVDWTAE
jgi:Tol biopolymer transport system component